MKVENPNDYILLGFLKSKTKNKKYDAVLEHKHTNKLKYIPFGDKRYEQYEDKTALALYHNQNHYDDERRRLYRLRHAGEEYNKFSSGWFSWFYLW